MGYLYIGYSDWLSLKNEANRWRSEICLIRSYANSLLIADEVHRQTLIDWLIDDHHKPLMIHTASCKFKLQLFSAANNSICSPNDLFYWPCYVLLINARGVYLEIPLSPLRSGDPLVHGFASFVLRESYLTWYSKVISVMYR